MIKTALDESKINFFRLIPKALAFDRLMILKILCIPMYWMRRKSILMYYVKMSGLIKILQRTLENVKIRIERLEKSIPYMPRQRMDYRRISNMDIILRGRSRILSWKK